MKLEIKLNNPKYCTFCPCHYKENIGKKTLTGCTMNSYINKVYKTPMEVSFDVKRPKRCIKKNGL